MQKYKYFWLNKALGGYFFQSVKVSDIKKPGIGNNYRSASRFQQNKQTFYLSQKSSIFQFSG